MAAIDQYSTDALLADVRTALLTFTPPHGDGRTVDDVLDGRLYNTRAPDNPTFPYGTFRLTTRNDGRSHGMRRMGELEVQLYGRPWAQREVMEGVADLFDQAALCLVRGVQGLTFAYGSQRETIPPVGAAVDSEVVTIRLVYSVVLWPDYLTRLTRTLP